MKGKCKKESRGRRGWLNEWVVKIDDFNEYLNG
jgi:hypothetical protein